MKCWRTMWTFFIFLINIQISERALIVLTDQKDMETTGPTSQQLSKSCWLLSFPTYLECYKEV